MAAEIIQLPARPKKHNSVRSVDLHFCWDARLNNPLLNSLYKQEVCYVERWYLQATHLLNIEDTSHPLLKLLLNKQDHTLQLLLDATEKDRAVQERLSDISSIYSTEYQIKKLSKWQLRWISLINHRNRL
jgi:hypothetical protein